MSKPRKLKVWFTRIGWLEWLIDPGATTDRESRAHDRDQFEQERRRLREVGRKTNEASEESARMTEELSSLLPAGSSKEEGNG